MTDSIRIAIGTDPVQRIACETLKSSIRRRTERIVNFYTSWCPATGWHPLMIQTPELKNGTAFNKWRWLVCDMFDAGRCIYLDADQVCLTDIGELWDYPLDGEIMAAVINAVGVFGRKTPQPDKVQTSVMLLDYDGPLFHGAYEVRRVAEGKDSYAYLMQAEWLDRDYIAELPPEWNHFGIHTEATKILHWSHVKSQPYRNPGHPTAWVFEQELRAAIEAGHISPELLRQEAAKGHVHGDWLKVLA